MKNNNERRRDNNDLQDDWDDAQDTISWIGVAALAGILIISGSIFVWYGALWVFHHWQQAVALFGLFALITLLIGNWKK